MKFVKAKITIPEGVLAREVGGEIVFLNLDNEQYYGLDEIGARMWAALTTTSSFEAALEILYAEFDIAQDVLRRDLEDLVHDLQSQGLVEVTTL